MPREQTVLQQMTILLFNSFTDFLV